MAKKDREKSVNKAFDQIVKEFIEPHTVLCVGVGFSDEDAVKLKKILSRLYGRGVSEGKNTEYRRISKLSYRPCSTMLL
jgi:phosphoheptose isomerase